MLRFSLVALALFAPVSHAMAVHAAPPCCTLDVESFEGWCLKGEGEVLAGEFSIEWEGAAVKRIRHVLKSKRPTQKGVRLLVDEEGLTRLPRTPSLAQLPDYLRLAAGIAGDEADARAVLLGRFAASLAQDVPDLALALRGKALTLAPSDPALLEAMDALPEAQRLQIWREALAGLRPEDEPASLRERVASLFPAGVVPEGGWEAGRWLALYVTLGALDARWITDPDAKTPGLIPAERKLGTYRHSQVWGREDLFGLRTEHLFLVTPLRDPRALRLALLRGEFVCNLLEELFAGVEVRRSADEQSEDHDMLIVFLFESREEYLRLGENLRTRGQSALHAHTAGFFSAGDRISRFYLAERGDPYATLGEVLAHELTHHWIFTSCRGFTNEEAMDAILKGRAEQPGHWIVEGFASLVEEFAYDDEAGTYSVLNPRSSRLDTIANAKPEQLLPWDAFFAHTHRTTHELDPEPFEPEVLVPISWMEGRVRVLSEMNLFYAQAAATCHALYAEEDGAAREALLQFLVDYYSGNAERMGPEAAFGLDGAALGARVAAHCAAWSVEAAALRADGR